MRKAKWRTKGHKLNGGLWDSDGLIGSARIRLAQGVCVYVWLATDERRSNRLAFSNDERVSMSKFN